MGLSHAHSTAPHPRAVHRQRTHSPFATRPAAAEAAPFAAMGGARAVRRRAGGAAALAPRAALRLSRARMACAYR